MPRRKNVDYDRQKEKSVEVAHRFEALGHRSLVVGADAANGQDVQLGDMFNQVEVGYPLQPTE